MTTPRSRTASTSAHTRLLEAASVLFYNDGVNATGIDAIVKRAGVAKKSLYNNFASKSELIASYLEARHEEWLALYQSRLLQADTPHERVMAIFLAYEDHAQDAYARGFRGCGLLNAAAELPTDDPGREVVRGHKQQVESLLKNHVADLLSSDRPAAEPMARHLAFLLEGAMVLAGLEGSSERLREARSMAEAMLKTR